MLKPATPEAYDLLHRGTLALANVERNGIRIDVEYLDSAIADVGRQITRMEAKLRQDKVWRLWSRKFGSRAGFAKQQQLADIVFGDMGHEVLHRTSKGAPSTDEAAFEHVDLPFVRRYFRWKKLQKIQGTYLSGIRREVCDEYLYNFFHLHLVKTFRSSSSLINFQNIPIRDPKAGELIRRCFIPRSPDRVLVEIDFSGIEVRIAACYNKDPVLVSYIKDKTKDMHRDMAAQCYKMKPEQVDKMARYCNPPEAPMWMADGSFKPLGAIAVGDKLMGWGRDCVGKKKGKQGNKQARKRLRTSVVTAIHKKKDKIYKVTLSSGRVLRCTKDHLWVNGKLQFRGGDRYVTPEVGRVLAHIVEPTRSISKLEARTAGWLGGIYDGEGSHRCISQSPTHNPEVCARIAESLSDLGFTYTVQQDKHKGKCNKYYVAGGLQGDVDFLNLCKPARKKNWVNSITARSSFFKKDTIVKIEEDGYGDVLGLTTTTGNYVCWGYASKNCAKNMFVFPEFYGSIAQQCAPNLWGACTKHKLMVGETPMLEWLKQHGIKELGNTDFRSRTPLKPGTFVKHIKEVEEDFWNNRFKVYSAWKRSWYDKYHRNGGFHTLTGFTEDSYLKRNDVINHPVQGSAFHCLLWALTELNDYLVRSRKRSKLVGQIHDSILGDVHLDELDDYLKTAHWIMTEALRKHWKWINVPIEVEMEVTPPGGSWFEKKAVALAA